MGKIILEMGNYEAEYEYPLGLPRERPSLYFREVSYEKMVASVLA